MRTGPTDRLDGGLDTARLSAAEQDRVAREQREADARTYLLDRDLWDVAEVLGLVPPTCANCKAEITGKGWFCDRSDCRAAERRTRTTNRSTR